LRLGAKSAISRIPREVRVAPAQWRPDAPEHAPKLLPKVGVAERIEERVERRVEVPDPRHDRHQLGVDPVGANGHNRETHEVRQEADVRQFSSPASSPVHFFSTM